jgi:hypothetical protein
LTPTNAAAEYFAEEIVTALHETDVIEDYLAEHKIEANRGREYDHSWQDYLTTKIAQNRKLLYQAELILRAVALLLCKLEKNTSLRELHRRIYIMCDQPHRILRVGRLPPKQPWTPHR